MLTRFFSLIILSLSVVFPCSVCYGNPESPMSHGMNMGVLTLLGFIGFVLCAVAYSIISISIRTKNINNIEGKL